MQGLAPVAYRFVVAHWAPGVLAMYPLSLVLVCYDVDISLPDPITTPIVLAGVGAALVLGLLVDGIAFVTTSPLAGWVQRRVFRQASARRQFAGKEDFEFYDAIFAMNYSWSQLYGSCALLFFVSGALHLGLKGWLDTPAFIFIVLAVVFMMASARSLANFEAQVGSKLGFVNKPEA
jgi:hypothetical protein